VGDGVAAEQAEDIGILLFDAVFAIDEDEGATKSGGFSTLVQYSSGVRF
jgi:hypothetical protein